MTSDPASLDNLRDIVAPPAVPWWPPAPGWWILFAALFVAASVLGWRGWRTWRANAYRRAARRELHSATSVAEIAEILKRTALCAYPRTDIAALSGSAWCQWLGESADQEVPKHISEALTRGVFSDLDTANVVDVSTFATDWINRHHGQTAN